MRPSSFTLAEVVVIDTLALVHPSKSIIAWAMFALIIHFIVLGNEPS